MTPFRKAATLPIRFYRFALSPLLTLLFGPGSGCRYQPTCSEYAMEAILNRGVLRGSLLGLRRILRCHPWGGSGHDPAPLERTSATEEHVRSSSGS